MHERHSTRLRIIDEENRPVRGAQVSVVRSSVPFPEVAIIADDDGIVHLDLPRGEFTFRAYASGGRQGEASVTTPVDDITAIRIRSGRT